MIFFIAPDLRDDILSKTKCNWPDFFSFLDNVKETIKNKTSDLKLCPLVTRVQYLQFPLKNSVPLAYKQYRNGITLIKQDLS